MKTYVIIASFILLALSSLFIGVTSISFTELLKGDVNAWNVMLISRMPRLIAITLTGMGMSVSGLIMQRISQNHFVSPSTAATMDAARFGVLMGLLFFSTSGILVRMTVAFVFALIGNFMFLLMVKRIKVKNLIFIPLLGMMFGNIIESFTTFLATRFDAMQMLSSYMVGDFSLVIQGRYELMLISIPFVIVAFIYAYPFTLVGMGEEVAKNLGLNHAKFMTLGIVIVSITSSSILLTVGHVPFLGLIVPNVVSLMKGDNVKNTLTDVAFLGATLVLIADIFGRVLIKPYEIPIGLTLGVLGSMVFLILLFRRKTA